MSFKLMTWNVNSIRLRIELGHLKAVVEHLDPDVVCLQETKVIDELFPHEACAELGFPHRFVHGIKGYNGVAVLSKRPFKNARLQSWCGRADGRHAIVNIDGIELHNLYVPAGGDVPDRDANPKFAHKLDLLTEATAWWKSRKSGTKTQVLVGDLNIAPLPTDVWDHKKLLGVVSHTPIEVEHLAKLQAAGRWVDAVRHFIPEEQRVYTWWSYRSPQWETADKGRRLDHIWVSPDLLPVLRETLILKEPRGWARPSDHVPVMARFDL